MVGDTGKSIYCDLLERDPEVNAVRLQIDQYRPFKYYSAKELSEYAKRKGPPDVILIDAPRDEETKFLHEIYGVLEEINNGRLEGQFGGSKIKDSIPRKTPIIIFSNSPPVVGALSEDRWDIMAIYDYYESDESAKRDVLIQKARVSSNVHQVVAGQVYWQNFTETVLQTEFDFQSKSDLELLKMQGKNVRYMQQNFPKEDSGIRKKWGPDQVAPLHSAPSYVKLQARNQQKFYTN